MKKQRLIFLFSLFCLLFFFTHCQWGRNTRELILHPSKTGIRTMRYFDHSRERPVITELWYPINPQLSAEAVNGIWVRCPEVRDAPLKKPTQGKYPLIVMSHGNWSDRLNCSWIAEMLSANGYVVAAMDHYGNTWNNKQIEGFFKIWERPRDVSFVIDQIFQDPHFAPYIDKERVGFIGYSLGGQTGVWMAGGRLNPIDRSILEHIPSDQVPSSFSVDMLETLDFSPATASYKEERLSAFFLMAPALGPLFDPSSLNQIEVPCYIVAPESDQVVPVANNGKWFALQMKKGFFNLIPGAANHYVFLNEVSKAGKMILDKSFALDPPTVDRKTIHVQVGKEAIQFFNEHLKQ